MRIQPYIFHCNIMCDNSIVFLYYPLFLSFIFLVTIFFYNFASYQFEKSYDSINKCTYYKY